jgi:hypothetical protein
LDGGLALGSPVRAAQGQAVGLVKPLTHPPENLPHSAVQKGICPCYLDDLAIFVLRHKPKHTNFFNSAVWKLRWIRLTYSKKYGVSRASMVGKRQEWLFSNVKLEFVTVIGFLISDFVGAKHWRRLDMQQIAFKAHTQKIF